MKYKLARLWLSIGKCLHLPIEECNKPLQVKKCGLAYLVTDKDVKEFRKTLSDPKCSLREARKHTIENTKLVLVEGIMSTLINKGYLKIDTEKSLKGTVVKGEILVYGKEKDG